MLWYSIIDRRGWAEYSLVSAEATDWERHREMTEYLNPVSNSLYTDVPLSLTGFLRKWFQNEFKIKNQSPGY